MDVAQWLRVGWDRAGAVACVALGAIGLLIGWFGVSDKLYTAEQVPFVISGGIGGIFLLGLGGILWLSADLRDEWTQLDRLEALLARQEQARAIGSAASPQDGVDTTAANGAAPHQAAPAARSRTPRSVSARGEKVRGSA